jgi:hypothetical protein
MKKTFRVGDHVVWNSEAGHVSGTIIKVHTKDVDYKGYTHHASQDEPQYEIQSDKTDHIAMHKGAALRRASVCRWLPGHPVPTTRYPCSRRKGSRPSRDCR